MPTPKPEIVTEKHLTFLDELRESGITNMFGAPAFVQKKFKVSKQESYDITDYWMKSFSDRRKDE